MSDKKRILYTSEHPILQESLEVCWAIEKCGASVELTEASIKASNLNESISDLIRENQDIKSQLELTEKKLAVVVKDLKKYRNGEKYRSIR